LLRADPWFLPKGPNAIIISPDLDPENTIVNCDE
jgi:hypothetical protein